MAQLSLRLQLREQLLQVLGSLLPEGSHCALLNYPNIDNPGDHAIWLGERALLADLGVEVVYECEWRTYSPVALAETLDADTTILLQGGGNFGDLYEGQQSARERVVADFPDVRTIQLPQSIHFRKRRNLRRMQNLVSSHTDFTLLVREEQSRRRATDVFDVPVVLCPDAALGLYPAAPRRAEPEADITWLVNTVPQERRGRPPIPPATAETLVQAWPPHSAAAAGALAENAALLEQMTTSETAKQTLWRDYARTFEPLARDRLDGALAALARGRVVVTERLHGHILALHLGIPNVGLDYNYGKTRSFYETWSAGSDDARMAASAEEALEVARGMVTRAH